MVRGQRDRHPERGRNEDFPNVPTNAWKRLRGNRDRPGIGTQGDGANGWQNWRRVARRRRQPVLVGIRRSERFGLSLAAIAGPIAAVKWSGGIRSMGGRFHWHLRVGNRQISRCSGQVLYGRHLGLRDPVPAASLALSFRARQW